MNTPKEIRLMWFIVIGSFLFMSGVLYVQYRLAQQGRYVPTELSILVGGFLVLLAVIGSNLVKR